MINEFRAESLAKWKLSNDGVTLTLAFVDDRKNETHIHLPRLAFEALLPMIAQELQKIKRPEQEVYTNANGLDLGISKDGSVNLKFDLATGTPFCVHLPRGAAGGLLDGLKSAQETHAAPASRHH